MFLILKPLTTILWSSLLCRSAPFKTIKILGCILKLGDHGLCIETILEKSWIGMTDRHWSDVLYLLMPQGQSAVGSSRNKFELTWQAFQSVGRCVCRTLEIVINLVVNHWGSLGTTFLKFLWVWYKAYISQELCSWTPGPPDSSAQFCLSLGALMLLLLSPLCHWVLTGLLWSQQWAMFFCLTAPSLLSEEFAPQMML